MPDNIIDTIVNEIKRKITKQYNGSRRKDGLYSRAVSDARHELEQIRAVLKQRIVQIHDPDKYGGYAYDAGDEKLVLAHIKKLEECGVRREHITELNQLNEWIHAEKMADVLISQKDGSRENYLKNAIYDNENTLSERRLQGFSVFSTQNGHVEQLNLINILPKYRRKTRDVVTAASERLKGKIDNLYLNDKNEKANALAFCKWLNDISERSNPRTNIIDVVKIVDELDLKCDAEIIMRHYKALFIPPSGMSHLPLFFIDRQNWEPAESRNMLITSRRKNGKLSELSVDGRVQLSELKETLIDFAFLVAALELGKNVYGSCHGAHVGWLLAGGEMTKWNKYMLDRKYHAPDKTILNALNADRGTAYPENGQAPQLDENKYSGDEMVTLKCGDNPIIVKSDFDHATVMIKPDNANEDDIDNEDEKQLKVRADHPLANKANNLDYESAKATKKEDEARQLITAHLINTAGNAVEQFEYKTLVGTQSHPFKHTDDEKSLEFVNWALGGIGVDLYQLIQAQNLN